MAEAAAGDEDLEENAALAEVFKLLIVLPCGHRVPTHHVVAWIQCYIKQKKTEFSCPCFNYLGQSCGKNCSYQDIFQLIPLTEQQRTCLEEKLAIPPSEIPSGIQLITKIFRTVKQNVAKHFLWEGVWLSNNAERCVNDCCGETKRTLDPLILCKPDFKERKLQENGDDIYPVREASTDRKRLALLINNVEFKNLKRRTGADKDEQSVEVLLKGLGYTVITLRDLSAEGMLAALQDFAQREEHDQSDSCFVVLMSHGDAGGISGVFDSFENKDVFLEDNIFVCLNTLNCARLMDKPKIILIQSCRGDQDGSVNVRDAVPRREHLEKDFCCLRSCTPDTASYRNPVEGSLFIQAAVKIFNEYAHQDHIEKLFRKVIKKFEVSHPEQMPCKERTTLPKKFYLFPGL